MPNMPKTVISGEPPACAHVGDLPRVVFVLALFWFAAGQRAIPAVCACNTRASTEPC
jgi:hypothetical protein